VDDVLGVFAVETDVKHWCEVKMLVEDLLAKIDVRLK
jgi:hypothetical protein